MCVSGLMFLCICVYVCLYIFMCMYSCVCVCVYIMCAPKCFCICVCNIYIHPTSQKYFATLKKFFSHAKILFL